MRPTWEEGWWDLSVVYFSDGRYSEAIDPLKRVVELKPGFGTAWAMLGLSEYETKDYKNALIHLEKAQGLGIQGSPDAIRIAQYHLAVLLNQNREFERAVELLATGHPEGHSDPVEARPRNGIAAGAAVTGTDRRFAAANVAGGGAGRLVAGQLEI